MTVVKTRTESPTRWNMIRRLVPSSGREYDAINGEWIISGARVPALMGALRSAGVEVVENRASA